MKFRERIARNLMVLALLDQIVTIVLVGRGDKFALYFNYRYFADNYADSLLELWIFSLIRLAAYVGIAIAFKLNMRNTVERIRVFSKIASVVLCAFLTYSLVKLLVYSELEYFNESWRLGFFLASIIWDFIMCIVAYMTFNWLALLHTRFRSFTRRQRHAQQRSDERVAANTHNSVTVNDSSDDRTRLVGGSERQEYPISSGESTDELDVVFSSWLRNESTDTDDADSESDSDSEDNDAAPYTGASSQSSRTKGGNFMRLVALMRADLPLVALATCFLLLASVGEAVIPLFTARVVNSIVIERSYEAFANSIWSMLGVAAVSTLCAGGRAGLMGLCMYRVQLRLRARLFAALVRHELAYYDRTPVGDILSRLTTDTSTVGSLITINCNIFLRTLVKSLGLCGFMFYFSWRLSLLTIFSLSIFTMLAKIYGEYYEVLSKRAQAALAKANAVADEVLSTMRTVRSFANEMGEARLYAWKLDKAYAIELIENGLYVVLMIGSQLFQQILLTAVLFYGGHLVFTNLLSGSDLISFMLYQLQLGDCLSSISDAYSGLVQALGASAKVFEMMDREPAFELHYDDGVIPESFEGRIELRNVSFRYPTRNENELVLKNVSFTIAPGEIIALVGKSGSGKSSIISLIQHFYEPLSGQVLIDGRDVRDYNHRYLHTKMALVSQEPILYGRSIRNNIAYALDLHEEVQQSQSTQLRNLRKRRDDKTLADASRQSIFRYGFTLTEGLAPTDADAIARTRMKTSTTHHEVVHCAELSNAAPFIGEMRRGYDTHVGEKGCTVSGGQKQRVAIARALIREPKILLLDEATSALDSESESLVQQAIYRNLANRTVLIVAHRLSTIERADRIIVLDKGAVVESGSHQELLSLDGVYARLVKRQLLKEQPNRDSQLLPSSSLAPQPPMSKAVPISSNLSTLIHASRTGSGSLPKGGSLP